MGVQVYDCIEMYVVVIIIIIIIIIIKCKAPSFFDCSTDLLALMLMQLHSPGIWGYEL